MEFNIGDRIKVKEVSQIPEEHRTKAMGRLSGEVGTVTDKLWSENKNSYIYTLHLDEYLMPSKKMWVAEQLEPYVEATTTYRYEFDYLENLVVARLYEVDEDGDEVEVGRGHGHIIHEGALGIAQAASYALKKIYEKLNGGTLA